MRLGIIMLSLLLGGCQLMPNLNRQEESPPFLIMSLWKHYQQCFAANRPAEMVRIVEPIERVVLAGPEPPTWMQSWGLPATRQPLRTTVDPRMLSAACTMRAASILVG